MATGWVSTLLVGWITAINSHEVVGAIHAVIPRDHATLFLMTSGKNELARKELKGLVRGAGV